ncbi:hypothetical protein AVEN_106615-1 [Araneus ventricosus]|uniref:Uncharacterized protein n=1 Tax=Araneus ventricosus TaxID=182803 RepID=A0A4Y2W371_ARAVE|nr:hypothetical protein AVEN_217173-1 [Araneus ventricosus]GBO31715.1 hypothetical protein AVEN_106615-1 [Araneus ventricosus]
MSYTSPDNGMNGTTSHHDAINSSPHGSAQCGCEDATEYTVTEWLSCDTEANLLYTDEEIICLVQNKPRDDSDLEETDEPENVLVSHSETANALEIALRYIEQSENATSTDIMFMRRWHNIASASRITSLRQTNFFTPEDR